MAKAQLSDHLRGKYRLAKGFSPGLYEFSYFGKIDFRTATVEEAERLIALKGHRYLIPLKKPKLTPPGAK